MRDCVSRFETLMTLSFCALLAIWRKCLWEIGDNRDTFSDSLFPLLILLSFQTTYTRPFVDIPFHLLRLSVSLRGFYGVHINLFHRHLAFLFVPARGNPRRVFFSSLSLSVILLLGCEISRDGARPTLHYPSCTHTWHVTRAMKTRITSRSHFAFPPGI